MHALNLPACLLLLACHRPARPCECALGYGFQLPGSDVCQCVPPVEAEPPPDPAATFAVGPDEEIDWPAVNAALSDGDVQIDLSGTRRERLYVQRTDTGPYRLVIDGGRRRAVVPGVSTGYEGPPQHRVTVRRLEVTGSRDKGVYWWAGDDIVLEELYIHDNRGSPAVSLDYANRTGHASTRFVLRNSHIHSQPGECVYIGGSEGTDQDAHAYVEVSGNLIHDCRRAISTQHDGINIKDRIGHAEVRRNVILHADWGLELASPGLYAENIVIGTDRNGVHFNDEWGEGHDGIVLEDLVVVDPGESGLRLSSETRPTDGEGIRLQRILVVGAPRAGLTVGAGYPLRATITDLHIEDSDLAFEGWGEPDLAIEGCTLHGNGERADDVLAPLTESCEKSASIGDMTVLSGPDRVFFTEDDPWRR